MYKGVVPFITLQLIGLAIVGMYPPLVNYLPNRVNLTSETAPPPRNPRISACVEESLFRVYERDEELIKGAIREVKGMNLGFLPENWGEKLCHMFSSSWVAAIAARPSGSSGGLASRRSSTPTAKAAASLCSTGFLKSRTGHCELFRRGLGACDGTQHY